MVGDAVVVRVFAFVVFCAAVAAACAHASADDDAASQRLRRLIEQQDAVLAFHPELTAEQLRREREMMEEQDHDARLTLHGDLGRIRRAWQAQSCSVAGDNPLTATCATHTDADDTTAALLAVVNELAFSDLRVLRVRQEAGYFAVTVEQFALPRDAVKRLPRPSPPRPHSADIDALAAAGAEKDLVAAARARQARVDARAALLSRFDDNEARIADVIDVVAASNLKFQHELFLENIVFDVFFDGDDALCAGFDAAIERQGTVARLGCTPVGAADDIVQRAHEQQNVVVAVVPAAAGAPAGRLHLVLTLR